MSPSQECEGRCLPGIGVHPQALPIFYGHGGQLGLNGIPKGRVSGSASREENLLCSPGEDPAPIRSTHTLGG